jgi:hypothetical protein
MEVNMIPQAIANTGPYASLWSDLKSMRHALERATAYPNKGELTELDKARLHALSDFLKSELDPKPVEESEFLSLASAGPQYSLDVDLRQLVKNLSVFEEWHRSARMGYREKILKLIAALQDYLSKMSDNLFPKNPPVEEFKVLHAILSELLLRTETVLLT